MASQGSFEDRIGKFTAGNTLVQSWGDYDPANPLITKAACNTFIGVVEAANTDVVAKKNALGDARNARKTLCFTQYDDNEEIGILNPNCAEERIVRVHSYLVNLLPKDSAITAAVKEVLKKIRPSYKGSTANKSYSLDAGEELVINNVVSGEPAKNTGTTDISMQDPESSDPPVVVAPGQEAIATTNSGRLLVKNLSSVKRGRIRLAVKTDKTVTRSPMEKTFASIPGFLDEVITSCSNMPPGVDYDPPDALLAIAELEGLRDDIRADNAAVNTALNEYGNSNKARKKLYDSTGGMTKRIGLIKSYLASFQDGKKGDYYVEYSQAIKGT